MDKMNYGRGICYSGYRKGQNPGREYPTYKQTLKDLKLIIKHGYTYIRMYNPCPHSFLTCQIIKENNLPLKVMLGLGPTGEKSNLNCPWNKQVYTQEQIDMKIHRNNILLEELIFMANCFEGIIFCVSVGNENTAFWTGDLLSEDRLIEFADKLHSSCKALVTFNEGAYEWKSLQKLVKHLDIISIHSYPQWHKVSIKEALLTNIEDYNDISKLYSDKKVIFTEFGWTTKSTSEAMIIDEANEENQKRYYDEFYNYFEPLNVLSFAFEAFDEPWKGGNDDNEPEKHWGLIKENRKEKLYLKK